MVNVFLVDDQEAVVRLVELSDLDRGVLGVMLLDIQGKLFRDLGGINSRFHTGGTLGEKHQDGFVDIVVDQDNRTAGGADQAGSEFIGIEQLAVIKDTFYGRQGGADEEVDLFAVFPYDLFESVYPLVDGITFQEIFFQHLVCPDAELGAAQGFYPVTDGDNDIQIIELLGSSYDPVSFLSNL